MASARRHRWAPGLVYRTLPPPNHLESTNTSSPSYLAGRTPPAQGPPKRSNAARSRHPSQSPTRGLASGVRLDHVDPPLLGWENKTTSGQSRTLFPRATSISSDTTPLVRRQLQCTHVIAPCPRQSPRSAGRGTRAFPLVPLGLASRLALLRSLEKGDAVGVSRSRSSGTSYRPKISARVGAKRHRRRCQVQMTSPEPRSTRTRQLACFDLLELPLLHSQV